MIRMRESTRDIVQKSGASQPTFRGLQGAIPIIALIVLWESTVAFGVLNSLLMPAPSAVVSGLVEMIQDGTLLLDVWVSIQRVLVGFLCACLLGIPVGIWLGWNDAFSAYCMPALESIRPIPPIAWIPIAIFWFGVGDRASYFITAVAAFFPVLLNAHAGASSVEKIHIHAALSLGASRRQLFTDVLVPSALPFVMTGLRVALGMSWMSVVAAELIGAQSGLGYMIQLQRMLLDTRKVLAGMAVIGLGGYVMNRFLLAIQHVVLPWKSDWGR